MEVDTTSTGTGIRRTLKESDKKPLAGRSRAEQERFSGRMLPELTSRLKVFLD